MLDFLIAGLVGAFLAVGLYFLVRHVVKKALYASLEMRLYSVRIPKSVAKPNDLAAAIKEDIGKFEQLLGVFSSARRPIVFEAAVPHVGEEICFYVSVPEALSATLQKQIQGIWPGASIELVREDYNIFNAQGESIAAYFGQKENYALPIRTYVELGTDTFASTLSGFTKIREIGEGASLQVIVSPAKTDARKRLSGYVRMLKKGEPLSKVLGREFPLKFETIRGALNPEAAETEKKEKVVEEDAVKALEAKVAKPLFLVNVRAVVSAPTIREAEDVLDGIVAGFGKFFAPLRNSFKLVRPRNARALIYKFVFRNFDAGQAMVLNTEEIASIFHFPTPHTDVPKIKWLKSREAAPPLAMGEGVVLGESVFRGEKRPVALLDDDRRRHLYVVGQTGTGKSTLLSNMIAADIQSGKGVAVIDPHGDLAEGALAHVPESRAGDVIYFDPSDLWRPMGLNMLEYRRDRPEEKTFIVNELQSMFNKLFAVETMGPMFEQYMRNDLLLLMEDSDAEPATLIEVPRVMSDAEYRKRKLARIKNPVVIDFWEKEAAKTGGEASIANMTPYITSKFNNFIANDYMRVIIGQTKSAFNFRDVLDQGKILLVNLSKGRIGDINANLLGMIITGKLLMAALSRVDTPQESRRDFNLYIDEFQNFTTDSIATILSEARKYRLNLIVAHQFIAQLTDKVRDAVFGNVGSQVIFRVGAQDAEFLTKQFAPVFNESDLTNIDNYNAYVKMLMKGETVPPFNIHTFPPEPGNRERADALKGYSRLRYGKDKQDVDEDILRRLRA